MATLSNSLELAREIQAYKRAKPGNQVRQEVTDERDLDFSHYLRDYCRPSRSGLKYNGVELGCFVVTDLDWIVEDYRHKLIQLIEVKTRGGRFYAHSAQAKTFGVIDELIQIGIRHNEGRYAGYSYLGLHTLVLEGTTPIKSTWREWDGERISAEECWRRINMFDAVESKLSQQHETKEGLEREPVEVRAAEPPTTGGESASAKQAAEPSVDSQVQEQDKQPL